MNPQFLKSLESEVSHKLLNMRSTKTWNAANKGSRESRVSTSRSGGLVLKFNEYRAPARKFDRPATSQEKLANR